MMSQQRSRKSGGVAMEPSRGRSVVRASGDSMSANDQKTQPPAAVRSTSKNKIPKSLRYDLENALVGLCDVWFEEIKPHLVRNNIKVHVHGAGPASGDHPRLPPGAPGCSHLDPGAAPDLYQRASASCADYCSTQPTASRAQCRRPRASRRPACPPPVSSPAKLRNPHRSFEAKTYKNCARPPPPRQQPPRDWRTPRLCRTYSILAPSADPPRRTHTAYPRMTRRTHYKRRPKKIDKSTQTPVLRKPETVPWEGKLSIQQLIRQELHKQKLLAKKSDKQLPYIQELHKQELSRPDRKRESSNAKVTSPSCLRCPATTMLCADTHCVLKTPPAPPSPLFQEDLINIIAEKNDKRLRLLYNSPAREERTSSLNLLQPPARTPEVSKVPWR